MLGVLRGGNNGVGGIWMLPLEGDRKPQPFVEMPKSLQLQASFHLVAAGWRICLRKRVATIRKPPSSPIELLTRKYQITTKGAAAPLWSPDGKQIFYWWAGKIFVIDVRTEPAFSFGQPSPLLFPQVAQAAPGLRNFDITPDGRQFLIIPFGNSAAGPTPAPAQINVVLNWFEDLKQRVAVH